MAFPSGDFYIVNFHKTCIEATVTASSRVVDAWISQICTLHSFRLNKHKLIVGLDIEWRPYFKPQLPNPPATIQLCIGRRCLIFQFLHADTIPLSLAYFLANKDITFVGVGVKDDADKLLNSHGLQVSRTMDVAEMAVAKYKDPKFGFMGLKKIALELTGKEMEKPKDITLSSWDAEMLSYRQVEYACIDAFVSFELGMKFKDIVVKASKEERRSSSPESNPSPKRCGRRKHGAVDFWSMYSPLVLRTSSDFLVPIRNS